MSNLSKNSIVNENPLKYFSLCVKKYRRAKKWSEEKLAEYANMHGLEDTDVLRSIQNVENKCSNINIKSAAYIAKALEVPLGKLLPIGAINIYQEDRAYTTLIELIRSPDYNEQDYQFLIGSQLQVLKAASVKSAAELAKSAGIGRSTMDNYCDPNYPHIPDLLGIYKVTHTFEISIDSVLPQSISTALKKKQEIDKAILKTT